MLLGDRGEGLAHGFRKGLTPQECNVPCLDVTRRKNVEEENGRDVRNRKTLETVGFFFRPLLDFVNEDIVSQFLKVLK